MLQEYGEKCNMGIRQRYLAGQLIPMVETEIKDERFTLDIKKIIISKRK